MKTYSDNEPLTLLPLGDGNYHVNYNVRQTTKENEDGTESQQYECDTVFIEGEPTTAKIANAILRDSYTADEESMLVAEKNARDAGLETTSTDADYMAYAQCVVNARNVAERAMESARQ